MLSAARLYPAQHRWIKTETERSSIVTSRVLAKNGILCKYLWYDSISTRWKQQQQIEEEKKLEKKIKREKKAFVLGTQVKYYDKAWCLNFMVINYLTQHHHRRHHHQCTKRSKKKEKHETKQIFIEENRMRIHMVFIRLITFHFRRFSAIIRHTYFFRKLITSRINEAIIIQ